MKQIAYTSTPAPSSQQLKNFETKVLPLLEAVYAPLGVDVSALGDRLLQLIIPHLPPASDPVQSNNRWSQNDVLLITYGDSITKAEEAPLKTLYRFLSEYLKSVVSGVHILPFFPYSSDDGFAVIDYLQVNPILGDWEDIAKIADQFDLMTDLVMNHISSKSEWFEQFKKGQTPGKDYFIAIEPTTDVSGVTRPRSSPLLSPVETPAGTQHVWTTFSDDQVDLNFANPDVLLEFVRIILHYLTVGTKFLRLDAIGYLWKILGTPCIHLTETHQLIQLVREVVALVAPEANLVTETNVPNKENLSYFGDRNEAHLIYNFSLPPLLVNALLQERADHLKTWMKRMPPAPMGCAYFNFTASHDGIGMRPTEGLLGEAEYSTFLRCMEQFGGQISMRAHADGTESPYEVNISLFDAMKGTAKGEDRWQVQRFICSQTIMMSLEGIPAFYIHSLLATPNNYAGVKKTGRKRSINRRQWEDSELRDRLSDPNSIQATVLRSLSELIQIRRRQPAFHPNATQYTLTLPPTLFGFWRQSLDREQSIFSVHNLTTQPQPLNLSDLNMIDTEDWLDLISGEAIAEGTEEMILSPYQSVWITNKAQTER